MTKRDFGKLLTKSVIELLEEDFNSLNFEDEMGGRMVFDTVTANGDYVFSGEFQRGYYDVCLFENMKLVGEGWNQAKVDRAEAANVWEDQINRAISELVQKLKSEYGM